MTLTFLGQSYEAIPAQSAAMPAETTGTYRGLPVRFTHAQNSPRSNTTLTYRGIRYNR